MQLRISVNQIYLKAKQAVQQASETTVTKTSWGLFSRQTVTVQDEKNQASFTWFADEQELLDYLVDYCIFWCCTDLPDKSLRKIADQVKHLLKDYMRQKASRSDLIFRLNNLLVPVGMEIAWFGTFSELVFGTHEIPRRTRLFCRQTLADMEEAGINPRSDAPIEAKNLPVFIECLGDFGLENQGLNDPLPVSTDVF